MCSGTAVHKSPKINKKITERFPPVIPTISNYDLLSDTLCVVTHYDTSVTPALHCIRPFGF